MAIVDQLDYLWVIFSHAMVVSIKLIWCYKNEMIIVNLLIVLFQAVEIPLLKVTKKIKSIQMFHKPVQRAMQVSI